MRNRTIAKTLGTALLLMLGAVGRVQAEDIDLFLNNPLTTATRPNVLIVIDNAANNNSTINQLPNGTGSKKLDMIRDVLNVIVNQDTVQANLFPPCNATVTPRVPAGCITPAEVNGLLNNINLGLMVFNSGSAKGGYVLSHIRPMNVPGNRNQLWNTIKDGIPTANNAPYAKAMHEAYLYFGGKTAYVGFSGSNYDRGAQSPTDSTKYRSPLGDPCQPTYIIFLGNGGPDSSEDNDARDLLRGLGGVLSTDPLRFTPDNYMSSWFDEYARTLNNFDINADLTGQQKATTYTAAIQSPSDNNFNTAGNRSSRELLKNAAAVGGGGYVLAQDGQTLLEFIAEALRKMQPVNSVFAAVTLPVSVNVRGTFLNQVYMGQFRPDRNARPRWPGNLKQYKIGADRNGNPILVDRFNQAAEDTAKGFLLSTITSFWTQASTFWSFTTMGASDAPDGAVVEKGGIAQRMRADYLTAAGRTARNLYTCNGDCGSNGTPLSNALFNSANGSSAGPSAANLGVTTSTDRDALIEWVRGADNKDDENANTQFTDARAYIHGDLLHSRPAVVNYNRTTGNRDIVVYYGTNDGIFRAIKGGQDDADGFEKWGIVFPEFFSKLKLLRDNDTVIGVSTSKPYFADGPVSVFQRDANNDGRIVAADNDKVWLYVAMRRGGRLLYALDVSNPDVPKFMWKIDPSTLSGGTAVYAGLGQTWSTARPTVMKTNSARPVVVFGGGYDPTNEDPTPPLAGSAMGNGIYVVDAENGTFLKYITHPDMGAIAGDLTLVDRDNDGKTDRIYAADSKGNVWRVDVDSADTSRWAVWKLASLGGTGADGRKFLNKVDVVLGASDYDAVLVGSGDREHPFETSVTDRFYMIKDTFIGVTGGLLCGTTASPATCTHADLTDVTSNSFQGRTLPSGSHGWYISLGAGEKVVSSPLTVFGSVIFSTNTPTPSVSGDSCGNLGEARIYQVDYRNAGAVSDVNADGAVNVNDRYSVLSGGGYPPPAVYSRTDVNGKTTDVVCIGTHCFKPGGASFDTRRYRTYWYKK